MTILGIYHHGVTADSNVYRMIFVEICHFGQLSLHLKDANETERILQNMTSSNLHGPCLPSYG